MSRFLPSLALGLAILAAGIASDAAVPSPVAADCASQPAPPDRIGVGYRGTVTGAEEYRPGLFRITLSVERTLAGPTRTTVTFDTADYADCDMIDGSAIHEGDELVLVGTDWWRPRTLAFPFAWRATDGGRWDLSVVARANRRRLPDELRHVDTYPEILAFIGAGLPPTDAEPSPLPSPMLSVRGEAEDDLFRLTVTIPETIVETGDVIPITTTVARTAPMDEVTVRHPGDHLIQYAIERLDGGFDAVTNPGPECGEATFASDEVRWVTFGQAEPGKPDATVWSPWLDDTLASLEPGAYRFTATMAYGLFGCERTRTLTASIGFVVVERSPAASPEVVVIPTIPVPSGQPEVCATAELIGRLVAGARWVVVVASDPVGLIVNVLWPSGWSARRDGSGLALLDGSGTVVAREGDEVSLGGGEDADGHWRTCSDPDLVVQPE